MIGVLFYRHFNELDHELHSRLTRAYKPATKYLASFSSPMAVLLGQHVTFMCSSLLAVFIGLSFVDNEILYWEHVRFYYFSRGVSLPVRLRHL